MLKLKENSFTYFLFSSNYSKWRCLIIASLSCICTMGELFFFSSCRLASSVCHHVSTLIGLRWELRGRERLEKNRACIIVANHQSSIDILGMFDLWPVMDKCTVVAKKEVFYVWPVGLAAWLCGLIFIDRMNSEKARSILNTATKEIIEKKVKNDRACWQFAFYVFPMFLCYYVFHRDASRSSCGYSPRAPGITLVKYTRSKRVPFTPRSGRSYPYYQSYSPLIISYPRKRRDLIPVSNCEATKIQKLGKY